MTLRVECPWATLRPARPLCVAVWAQSWGAERGRDGAPGRPSVSAGLSGFLGRRADGRAAGRYLPRPPLPGLPLPLGQTLLTHAPAPAPKGTDHLLVPDRPRASPGGGGPRTHTARVRGPRASPGRGQPSVGCD